MEELCRESVSLLSRPSLSVVKMQMMLLIVGECELGCVLLAGSHCSCRIEEKSDLLSWIMAVKQLKMHTK